MPPPYPAPAIHFRKPPPSPEECDGRILAAIRRVIVGGAQPPDFARLASALELRREDVCASFRHLARAGTITLWPETHSIRLVPPFTAGYGDVWVGGAAGSSGARGMSTSGLWHALGIPAALASAGVVLSQAVVSAHDPAGGEPIRLRLEGPAMLPEPDDPGDHGEPAPIASLTAPFARWWDDPVAAIPAIRLVRAGGERAGEHAGTTVPLRPLCALASAWHAEWPRPRRLTRGEARALVAGAGLDGPEWQLP
ncbi:MAG: serine/threonine-protein kinase [Gemmatimonadaceae bacterium]